MSDIKIVIQGEILDKESIVAAIQKAIAADPEITKGKIVTVTDSMTYSEKVVLAIQKLVEQECSSVIIHHPNPELKGPNQVIETSLSYENLNFRFEGDSLLECLQKALAFKGKAID